MSQEIYNIVLGLAGTLGGWWEETEHDVSKFTNAQEVLKFLKP